MARLKPSQLAKESHHALFTRREWRQNGLEYIRTLPSLIVRIPHINHVLLHAVIEPPRPVSDELAAKMYIELENYAPGALEASRDYLHSLYWNEADGLAKHLDMQIGIIALSPFEAHDQYRELKYGI